MPPARHDRADLARLMVGRTVLEIARADAASSPVAVVLSVSDVSADNDRGLPALRGVSLDVARRRDRRASRRSPATARRELAEVITGLRPCTRAASPIDGDDDRQPARRATPSARASAHVPEDRTGVGSAPNLSLVDNLIMKRYRARAGRPRLVHRRRGGARRWPSGLKDEYAIAAPSIDTQARLLSGGNLQRLILAREIDAAPDAAGRRPADPRPRRRARSRRVHQLLLERRERGHRDPADLRGARRAPRAGRPDRRACTRAGSSASFDAGTADIHEIGLLMTGGGEPRRAAGGDDRGRPRPLTSGSSRGRRAALAVAGR